MTDEELEEIRSEAEDWTGDPFAVSGLTYGEVRRLVEALREAREQAERVRGLREWCSVCGEARTDHDREGCEAFDPSGCFYDDFDEVVFPWEGWR